MRIRRNILILVLLCSCNGENSTRKTQSELKIESTSVTEKDVEIEIDYSQSAEIFAKQVLKDKFRSYQLNLSKSDFNGHWAIFKSDGLEKLIGYSNRNYPKGLHPKYYEHFILFVATYHSKVIAESIFERIKSDSKYGLREQNGLENQLSERVKSLNIGAKPGGMIMQAGRQIFSLVETCRDTPTGENWMEYENKFVGFITEDGEEIEVLNSDCGMDKYMLRKIKAYR